MRQSALALVAAAGAVYALYRQPKKKRVVLITGGGGNLGVKLAVHLLSQGFDVVIQEHPNFYVASRIPEGARVVLGDLIDPAGEWRAALRGVDTVVHFSAVNPYPNASWAESAGSMSHTFNVFVAAAQVGVRRVIHASSNHVMGQYKDMPEAGPVTPDSPPACGSFLRNPADAAKSGNAVAYAAAKLAGERLASALAVAHPATTFVVLRIGWCQPGANLPSTLSASGCPAENQTKVAAEAAAVPAPDADVDETWFKSMWLSNGDFVAYFTAAIDVAVPRGTLLLNAMSNNKGMRWDIGPTQAALGVKAMDDSFAAA